MAKVARSKGATSVEPAGSRCTATVISLKGSPALRDWLSGASKKTHVNAAMITRLGFALWARANGIEAPPEK